MPQLDVDRNAVTLTAMCQHLRGSLKMLAFFYPAVVKFIYVDKNSKTNFLEIPNPKAWYLEAHSQKPQMLS